MEQFRSNEQKTQAKITECQQQQQQQKKVYCLFEQTRISTRIANILTLFLFLYHFSIKLE